MQVTCSITKHLRKKGSNHSLLLLVDQALIGGRRHPKECTCHSSLPELAYYLCSHGSTSAILDSSAIGFYFQRKRKKGKLAKKQHVKSIIKKKMVFVPFPSRWLSLLAEEKGEVEEREEWRSSRYEVRILFFFLSKSYIRELPRNSYIILSLDTPYNQIPLDWTKSLFELTSF